MHQYEINGSRLAVEYFAAKDSSALVMMVPCECGLKQADTLRISGLSMEALCNRSILPIDLPMLNNEIREKLIALAVAGQPLAVGEFMARGLFDYYSLRVVII